MSLSDRIAVMNHGRIEQIGTPQEVYAKPVNRFVADFMGRKTTFLDGKVMGFDENLMHVSVIDAVLPFERVSGINTGDDVELVVRSETVDIVPPGCGTFPGRIIHAAYFGSQVLYEVDLLGTTITAEIPDPQEREVFTQGSEVGINLKTRSIHVLPRANNGQIT
jgi:ABC-type Fe3+/spermidine/putrescine transport system ATPase subunit